MGFWGNFGKALAGAVTAMNSPSRDVSVPGADRKPAATPPPPSLRPSSKRASAPRTFSRSMSRR